MARSRSLFLSLALADGEVVGLYVHSRRFCAETGSAIDVWCLGIVLYALVCGKLPFDSPTGSRDETLKLISRCAPAVFFCRRVVTSH